MGSYRIRSGDTLSSIAQRHNTSVDALMKANTQIKDANVILADDKLNIPGAKDEFVEGGGTPGGTPPPGQQYNVAGNDPVEGPAEIGEMPEGQVGDWIRQATDKLKAAGVPVDKMNPQDIAKIIQHESSGNPNAINLWDDNAKRGTPSIGLMQTIQPTFDAYKLPGHDNIRDPVDNIIAGVRYAIDRYGSVSNVPGLQSMNGGGGYVGY
ncbi:LysM peptidoglycan-binding domain-containing protein [Cystobacter ferrugineus]|uniref:LysM peptidoglycan-binding domain-containing protein n=1 Tax=Cystobacter ferrugineus TaxID=83449 RepID=UPI0009FED63A|nr:LysM peptidoglycan-binding domain-containing protein [Cystobacter ferrugineus]